LTILAAVAASVAVLSAQGTTAPPPQDPEQLPTFRVRVDSISVDVSVTDRQGVPVTDLKQEDFEIREGGKVQTIDSFRLIQASDDADVEGPNQSPILSLSQMQRATADPQNRLFIIYLDDFHTRPGNALHIREMLATFIKGLSPRDLLALVYPMTPISAVTFSRYHEGTANDVMQFEGRKYIYNAKTAYENQYVHYPPEVQEQIRNELTIRTMRSACALASSLREGRKTILYVSEGLSANIPAGAYTMGGAQLYPPRGGGSDLGTSQSFFNTADLMGRMRDIFSDCTRGNTSIYTLDPRGLAPTEFGAADNVTSDNDRLALNDAIDSLRTLADETDGRAIIGRNNPLPELKKMVKELSSYYLLGYTSSIAPRDGRFHPIDVRVNRRDVDVHARKGYWAYTEDELRKAAEPPKPGPPEEVADALDTLVAAVEPTNRRPVAVWFGAVRTEEERPLVTFVWESTPGTPDTPADQVARVGVTATAADGEVVFKGTVDRNPEAVRPSGRVSFPAPSGPIRLRVVPENARGQKIDSEDVSELVPDFTGVGPTITSPQVFRARTARDIAQLRGSTNGMPVAARQFSRTERLFLRFDAYGAAATAPRVSMRLLNPRGEPLATLPDPPAPTGNTYEAEVSLASLPPGDYLIEIAAQGAAGRTVSLLGIRVTG
jgi:VWFA-related protein